MPDAQDQIEPETSTHLSLRSRLMFMGLHGLLPLLTGTLIYIGWRAPTRALSAYSETLEFLRQFMQSLWQAPPYWVLYSLPDGLWAYSLVAFLGAVWIDAPGKQGKMWWIFALLLAVSYELAQLAGFASGNFSSLDLVVSAFGAFCAILMTRIRLGRSA